MEESLASEQTRTGTLDRGLAQLSGSLRLGLADISGLKEADGKLEGEMQRLSGSFNSLLKDAIRHSDVLELLLGEEVLEFLEWPVQDQEAHSIPALKEQLRRHNRSIASLLGNRPGTHSGTIFFPDHGADGSEPLVRDERLTKLSVEERH